jgi:hypothetical protein
MHIFERKVDGVRYRVLAQSVWDPERKRSVARQVVLGPAEPPPVADLAALRTMGTKAVGDAGALAWVAEQIGLVSLIDDACGVVGAHDGPSVGELAVAVAIQRACQPGPKRDLAVFLDGCVPRVSCLPATAFTGQAFHRAAEKVTDEQLQEAQVSIARAAVTRFSLSTDVLAFDTTNFDTHIATTTTSELARRGHAKSKRADLRVVGLGLLVSETGHVPLLHRTYPGNSSDQGVLADCMEGLALLHISLADGECDPRSRQRTVVRDGGSWSPQLELDLDVAGYGSLISLPLGHGAAEEALQFASKRGAMKPLSGKLAGVRAARLRSKVGDLDRTLIVVESEELLKGQRRGIAVALRKAKTRLRKLEELVEKGKIRREALRRQAEKILGREHLARFVIAEIAGDEARPSFVWRVDGDMRRQLEKTRLGRRVLCTDRHLWSTGRIVHAFRGQWNVEELFRRAKKGGVVPWAPSFQWADASLRLHTFATVLGLTLVALAKLAVGSALSARAMMRQLAEIRATLARTTPAGRGRPRTVMLAPDLTSEQRRAVVTFELERWFPGLSSSMTKRPRRRTSKG